MSGDRQSAYDSVAPPTAGDRSGGQVRADALSKLKAEVDALIKRGSSPSSPQAADKPPVVKPDQPGKAPKPYPDSVNPNDGSRASKQAEDLVKSMGPGPEMVFELFKATYNDRSRENIKPESLELKELHAGVKSRVIRWMLLDDAEVRYPRKELGNRTLAPETAKNPGHIYAVGLDKWGNPVVMLDYYRDNGVPRYYRQIFVDYSRRADGLTDVQVRQYMAPGQTAAPRTEKTVGPNGDIYVGKTVYTTTRDGICVAARQYSSLNDAVPQVQVDFARDEKGAVFPSRLRVRNANSGKIETELLNTSDKHVRARSFLNRMLLYGLFGN